MKTAKILSFIFTALLIFSSIQPAESSDYLNEVVRANNLYTEKKYSESAQVYESLVNKGERNGHLYYNLGNAYIRMGKTGHAILNYLKALKWIPGNENLHANLKFAIQQTQDKTELPPPGTLNVLFFWVNDFNINELIYFAMFLNFTFWICMALWIYFPALKIARNALLFLLLLSFASIGVKIKNESDIQIGVVLANSLEVKSGRAADAITLFQLHEGALITVTDKHDNWLEVRINEKQKGWVPQNLIGT